MTPTLPPPTTRRKRFRWWMVVIPGALLSAALVVLVWMYLSWGDGLYRELEAVRAELDATDPGWQLDDLEKARPSLPDDANSALVVMAVGKQVYNRFPSRAWYRGEDEEAEPSVAWESSPDAAVHRCPRNVRLEPWVTAALSRELDPFEDVRVQARTLADMPTGSFPTKYTDVGNLHRSRVFDGGLYLRDLNHLDFLLTVEEGDTKAACRSLRAAVNTGRSVGDPFLMWELTSPRDQSIRGALGGLERLLGLSEPAEQHLVEIQQLLSLTETEAVPLLQATLRRERAVNDRMFEALEAGRITPDNLTIENWKERRESPALAQLTGGRAKTYKASPLYWRWHARYLTLVTEFMDVPNHPLPEWDRRMPAEIPRTDLDGLMARMFTQDLPSGIERTRQIITRLRVAITALAAERYRRANGRWPERLADLVPDYQPEVPADPYDGQPLRMRRRTDGIVIYSVSNDKKDDGGSDATRGELFPDYVDLPFRLWDANWRGMPPAKD